VKHRFLPAARADLIRQSRYYLVDQDAPGVSARFRKAVRLTVEQLKRTPKIGSLVRGVIPGLRSWPVQGFEKFSLFYVEEQGELRVVHLLHGSRNIGQIFRRESRWQ
jgi:plasmid stabilization system protein ParE